MFVDEHMFIYIYVNQIKTANNEVGDFFFCQSSDAVEWSCFISIHWIKWQMRHMKMQWGGAWETND